MQHVTMTNGDATKPRRSFLEGTYDVIMSKPIGLLAIASAVFLFLILAFTVKPAYYRSGQGVCVHYSYESSDASAGPDTWGTLPCVFGVTNECASSFGQSPIDLSTDEESSCVENQSDGSTGAVFTVSGQSGHALILAHWALLIVSSVTSCFA